MAAEPTPDVVPAGEALKMAQKWLQAKGVKVDITDGAEDEAALAKPRPPGLGLGASFLPHHKGKLISAGLDKTLRRRLSVPSRYGVPEPDAAAPQPAATAAGEVSSDEEEAGRAAAFMAKPPKAAQPPAIVEPFSEKKRHKTSKKRRLSPT